MSKQKGRDAVLYINTTGANYVRLAGCRTKALTINNESIDVTTAPPANDIYSGGEIVTANKDRIVFTATELTNTAYNALSNGQQCVLSGFNASETNFVDGASYYVVKPVASVSGTGNRYLRFANNINDALASSPTVITASHVDTTINVEIVNSFFSSSLDGKQSVSISADAVFLDETAEATMNTAAMAETPTKNFRYEVPDFGTFTGNFHITSLDYSGELESSVEWSLTLDSNDSITWATV